MCEQGISPLDFLARMNGEKFSFIEIIRHLNGRDVIEFENPELLQILETICIDIIVPVNASGHSKRINEFGNYIEPFFINSCKQHNLDCSKPVNMTGNITNSGYPDCLLTYNGEHYYIEIKTYNDKNASSSLRSFYYSPLKASKITFNACHLLIGFETITNDNINTLSGIFSIVDLFHVNLTLKTEYNTSNRELYRVMLTSSK